MDAITIKSNCWCTKSCGRYCMKWNVCQQSRAQRCVHCLDVNVCFMPSGDTLVLAVVVVETICLWRDVHGRTQPNPKSEHQQSVHNYLAKRVSQLLFAIGQKLVLPFHPLAWHPHCGASASEDEVCQLAIWKQNTQIQELYHSFVRICYFLKKKKIKRISLIRR